MIGFNPETVSTAALERGQRRFILVDRDNTRLLTEPQRERADAREQVGDAFGAAADFQHEPRLHCFAFGRCLQECTGRQSHGRGADPQRRRAYLGDEFAMARQARQILLRSDARQRPGRARSQRTRAAHVDVEAGVGRGDADIERLRHGAEPFGDGPGRGQRAAEAFGQYRAAIDRDHMMRPRRGEADFEHVVGAAPGVKHGAAAALAMRVDQLGDRRVDIGLAERLDDEAALPGAIGSGRPMLQRAAAADAEVGADRRDALGARHFDGEELAAVGLAGPVLDFDAFARQRARHIDRTVGAVRDAVAAMSDRVDREVLNHVPPR